MKHAFVDAGMRQQIAEGGNEPRLLHEFFERQVRLRPDHPALECPDGTLTYAELDARANRVAAILRARHVGAGALVALYMQKSTALFAALLGVLKAGAGYVPIDPKFPATRVETIVEDARAPIVLTDAGLAKELAHLAAPAILIVEQQLDGAAPATAPCEPAVVTPADACYVIYTSGSTGRPKGVVIEHRNAVNFVRALRSVYRLDERERVYQGFSIAFDASVEEIWAAFSLGGTLVVPPGDIARSTFDAAEFIDARDITYFSTVPSFLAMVQGELAGVRTLVLGGEACPPDLVNRFARPGRRLLNTYGPTEATVVATAADCAPGKPVTIGTALPGYTTYVLDENLRPVKPGATGELFIGGESVARGYLNEPEMTAARFVQNPFGATGDGADRLYRTQDLVRLGENGQLQFLGRADGQVKIRGFRVELSEIEAVLVEHPSIRAAAVTVVEFGALKELAAFVVPESDSAAPDHAGIAALLRSRVPEYMVPRYLDVLDELPAMTSGKVDRKALPLPRTLFGGRPRTIVPPESELERAIVDVFEAQFVLSPISVEDDFFLDLRGHSLLASHAVTELRARLNTLQVSVPDLYAHRTARALARHLASLGVGAGRAGNPQDAGLAAPTVPLSRFRIACALLQGLGLLAFYAVVSAPVALVTVLALQLRSGTIDLFRAADIATTMAALIWPSWLVLSIVLKWIVIGRYQAGRYPVWGFYYLRWWLVTRFQPLSWSEMFVGTPLMSLYFRAMGARVGRHCSIGTPLCAAFDLVTIGDNTSIGADSQLLGYRVENGWLILGPVTIGSDCFVGAHSCLGLNTTMGDGARLDDMSHLADNGEIAAEAGMRGSPAEPARVELHAGVKPRRGRTFAYGLLHLGLIYAMGYVLMLSLLPGLALIGYTFYAAGPAWGLAAVLAAAPLSMVWYLLLVIAVKRYAIGQVFPGIYPLHSREYVKYWFLSYLLTNTRHIALALYATLFLPTFLRLLGARIGRRVEISTAMHIVPDLLEIGDGSFLADACIVGGQRVHAGAIEIQANKIGARTFIGNSAFVPAGIEVGDNGLIGVMSTPPHGVARTPDGTRWLGSPGFELPNTQTFTCFSDRDTYRPGFGRVLLRTGVELIRVFAPGLIAAAGLVLFGTAITLAYYALALRGVAVVAPVAALLISFVSVGLVALLKDVLMGEFTPTVKPLWCSYVWINEVINAVYETVSAAALTPLMGTPFIAPCLRMMGCRIGRWVFLETTLFSEFDLVEIGDRAALNLGSTIQTHLFEDRVMKADRLTIGAGCSIGNMAVVLYATEMQPGSSLAPLSVLMKGEVLPAATAWAGIPTRPVVQAPSIVPAALEPARPASHVLQVAPPVPRRRRQGIRAQLLGAPSPMTIQHRVRGQAGTGPENGSSTAA